MKTLLILPFTLLVGSILLAQHMGNAIIRNENFDNPSYNMGHKPRNLSLKQSTINMNFENHENVTLSIKGLANVKIDEYVVIFALTQTGENMEQVNSILDNRINNIQNNLKKDNIESFVDIISFIPMYAYEVEKKIFSKKTYNEIPTGFEIKKNIHVKYSDPKQIHKIIAIMAAEEAYDIAEVDCYSTNMEAIRKELQTKAITLLKEKIKLYENILNDSFSTRDKNMVDGFLVYYPIDLYDSYKAYASSSIKDKKMGATVINADKEATHYYNPIMDKEFDFVINPVSVETTIQVLYEVKLHIKRPKAIKPQEPAKNRYFIMNPTTGQATEIYINNTDK